ncbi:VanZ family protein [Microbacterium sp. STN6]|uniref:VanZ family protein n=1 Tax=Microbacterium sp. STN6 TaxID=2995588 RepID=UPI002260C8E2|nr:VanZ family protein [Microbacterium sp. STN6]MCX7521279.1 VanZ family protein [Microbacterium sp. STN6]
MLHRHPVLALITVAYLAFVGWLTLGPQPVDTAHDSWLWQLLRVLQQYDATSWITYSRLEFGANMAMFFPVGLFFLLLLGRRYWWLSIFLAFALTAGIESAQLSIPGRVLDVRDIISNTTGGALGVFVGLILTWRPTARSTRTA